MLTKPELRPTLWRTCRVLANRRRLEIFHFLLQKPDQTVSAVAKRFKFPVPIASESLRLLESRSLLIARRVGRYVKYRVASAGSARFSISFADGIKGCFSGREWISGDRRDFSIGDSLHSSATDRHFPGATNRAAQSRTVTNGDRHITPCAVSPC